jgi:murein DD-endopeptidase MepM/ murein hydrolase activator NlpD
MRTITNAAQLFCCFIVAAFALSSCQTSSKVTRTTSSSTPSTTSDSFDEYLSTPFPPADGFDFPFGNGDVGGSYREVATGKEYAGWYIATHFGEQYELGIHPGEDWNGSGGGNTDLGQDVLAIANGRVVSAANYGRLWGNVIVIEHLFYENQLKRRIRSVYAHLNDIKVSPGNEVRRKQVIGSIGQDPDKLFDAHLHLEIRWDNTLPPTYWPSSNGKDVDWVRQHYVEPSSFIRSRRKLMVPQTEPHLILVDQKSYSMRLYEAGRSMGTYQISLGQGLGPKEREGDNKTPTGMYFIVEKHRGAIEGPYGAYYGGHWIKVNYPNAFDAQRGRAAGWLTPQQLTNISAKWQQRKLTAQDTQLGGGIGFHGWNEEWDDAGPRHLSWGCVVMHLYDIRNLYDRLPEGTMVVIF